MSTQIARTEVIYGTRVTQKEAMFVGALREGLPPAAAAAKAGYREPANTSRALLQRPHIMDVVASLQAEIADSLHVSRLGVFNMLKEAYEVAKGKNDAGAMVRVASEINKMSGYYQPEGVSRTQQVSDSLMNAMQPNQLESVPDTEVAKLAGFGDE